MCGIYWCNIVFVLFWCVLVLFFCFYWGLKLFFILFILFFLFKSITWLICFFFGICIALLGVKKGFLLGLVLNISDQGTNKSDYHYCWLVALI